MNIAQLEIGKKVKCPADRGEPGFIGEIVSFSDKVNRNINNIEYVWVSISCNGKKSVWPSNRLI